MGITMKIQPLLFPSDDICNIESMYYRRKGNSLSLETYFNAFSVGKWFHYTSINTLTLCIRTQHDISIRCFNSIGTVLDGCNSFADVQVPVDMSSYVSVTRQEIPVRISHEGDIYCINFFDNLSEGDLRDGILYAELTFPFDVSGCELHTLIDGWYETDYVPVNSPDIALGICTYKREEFLLRNIASLVANIIDNPDSPLYGKLQIYISDNACSLKPEHFQVALTPVSAKMHAADSIHVYPNKNTGGAGGFTRTMSEAILNNTQQHFTHLLLMDDDIVLDTAVLERTYLFLAYLKEEFKACMIGASMLDLNRKYLQIEKGARIDSYAYTFYHKFFDLRNADLISANECPENAAYTGWWYCCIPTQHICPDNLPLPMFLHYDDVEYGLRAKVAPILLNGICVWHPPAVSKGAASIEYYDIRNVLILQSTDKERHASRLHTLLHISFLSVGELVRYRYKVSDARLMGYQDFHRGPEHFIRTDPVKKHALLGELNYHFVSPEEAGISREDIDKLLHSLRKNGSSGNSSKAPSVGGTLGSYILCILCHLLPPSGGTKVCSADTSWLPYLARRVYVYSPSLGKGYIVTRSYKQFFSGIGRYLRAAFHILKDLGKDTAAWNESISYLTSQSFWEKYLKL